MDGDDRWRAALAALWLKQSRWSRTGDRLKNANRSWTGPLVATGFAGVVFSTLSPEILKGFSSPEAWKGAQFAITVAGPLLVACSGVLTRELLGPKSEQAWIKARGVSEDLKSEGYIYAAGAPPYADRAAAPEALLGRIDAIAAGTDDVGPLAEPAPEAAKGAQHPTEALTVDDYIRRRVDTQRRYFQDHAGSYETRLRFWRRASILLALLSTGLGILAGARKLAAFNVWVAVLSTAIATIAAFVYASRFEFQAASYFATGERLENLVNRWRVTASQDRDHGARFVLDCEAALATQNRAWREEFSKRVEEKLKTAAAAQTNRP
jgi:hypothetical protein